MPSDLRLRLRRYSPEGVRGAVIDYATMGVSMPTSDVWAITNCQVSSRAYKALTFPMMVGLEWSTGDPDQRVPGGLFLLYTDSYDAAQSSRVHSITGVQYVPLKLGGAKVYPSEEALEEEGGGSRRGLSGTPGYIIRLLVEEAQARGWFPDLDLSFTDTLDSAGEAWDVTIPSFDATIGSSVWSLIQSFVKSYACEVSADFEDGVHRLDLWNPGHGTDHTATVQIAPEATAVPVKQDYSNVVTHIIGQLDDGSIVEHEVTGAPTTFGRNEAWVSLGGVSDPDYAEALLEGMDSAANTPAKETSITRQATGALDLLFRDYLPGDTVRYRADGGNWTQGRIILATLTCEGPKVTTQETFGRVILDPQTKLLGMIAASTGGIGLGGNGQGLPPTVPDAPNPATPTGFSATPSGYWDDNGQPQGMVEFEWNAVTQSDVGAPLLVDRYEVLLHDTANGSTETYVAAAAFENSLILTTGFPVGSSWEAQVVAVGAGGGRSIPSSLDGFTIPAPAIGVVPPVAPVVTNGLGMAIIVPPWEQDSVGTPAMPEQVTNLRVYASADGSTGWTLVGTAVSPGDDVKYVGITGDEWWFAATAVTSDGQETALGDATSITLTGVDLPDLSAQVSLILTGPLIETDPGLELGVKFSGGGIIAYDETGEVTMLVNALTGLVYFRDGLIDGSVLATGTVKAAAIEAGQAFVDLIQSISDQLDLSANTSVQITVGQIVAPLQDQVDGLDSELEDQRVFFTFDSNGFTVSEPGDPLAFRIGAGVAEILANGNVVSYWNESQLVVPSIKIVSGQIGNHQVTPDGTDGTIFRAVG